MVNWQATPKVGHHLHPVVINECEEEEELLEQWHVGKGPDVGPEISFRFCPGLLRGQMVAFPLGPRGTQSSSRMAAVKVLPHQKQVTAGADQMREVYLIQDHQNLLNVEV